MNSLTSPWIRMDLKRWGALCNPNYLTNAPKGSFLFSGEECINHVYIVRSGRILLSAFSKKGVERILIFVTEGGVFGEQVLAETAYLQYTAKTVSDCELYRIPAETFKRALSEDEGIANAFIETLLYKERALISHIITLSFNDTYHRVVRELLLCAEIYGRSCPEGILIDIPISQEQMGNRVQASRVTINKVIKRLINMKLIGRKGQNFILYNTEGLKKIDREVS